jgi:acyl-CoA synthetase (AMP-forming)/AMP-acid ligase II
VIEGGQVIGFAALDREVNRLVNGLRALGLSSGETAVWCGPNSGRVVTFMHACRKLGLVAVPLSYRLTPEEMHHVIVDSGAALVVVDAEQAPAVGQLAGRLREVRETVVFGGTFRPMRTWEEVLERGSDDEPPPPADYGAAMMYTSGTTGRPKGAVRTRSDRTLLGAMMAELRFGASEVHITTGPLYHAGPNAFVLLTHFTGGTVVVMRAFDPMEWLDLVARHRVTSTFATPTHLKRLVSLPDDVLASADLSSLRTLLVSAAPLPFSVKQEVIAKLGDDILYEAYGSTEHGLAAILRPEDQLARPGSCGRAYGGIELKVVGDNGEELAPGEEGELFVRTALAIDGYHGDAGELASLEGGWTSVGDVGYLDVDGYLYICDRRSDLVITGGMNVYPAEVEAALHAHPAVADAAVIGLPDDDWGERVHAVVQARPGRSVDVGELEAFVARRLAGYKRPRSWEVLDQLPRTDSGKLLRRVLRDQRRGEARPLPTA